MLTNMRSQCFVLLCLIGPLVAHAATPDARKFDVSGVKLGMGFDEARNIVMERFKVSKSAIWIDSTKYVHPISKQKELAHFSVQKGAINMVVHFQPSIPLDKQRPMVVAHVIYELEWSPENVQAMKEASIVRYGETSNGTIGTSWHWCEKPDKNPGNGCGDYRGARLLLNGTRLELHNPTYQQAAIDFRRGLIKTAPTF